MFVMKAVLKVRTSKIEEYIIAQPVVATERMLLLSFNLDLKTIVVSK